LVAKRGLINKHNDPDIKLTGSQSQTDRQQQEVLEMKKNYARATHPNRM